MSQLWHLLWQLISYYVTFMTMSRRQSRHFLSKTNAGMGNTPRVSCWRRIPAAWSSRSVNEMDLWFLGSAHGVPNDELCLRWMSMAYRESNSFLQWAHLKPNDMGNLFGPSGFPLPAPRRMLSVDCDFKFNLLQGSASGQIDSDCSETGTKHNSKRRIRTIRIVCIATDWSVAWMCTHHGLWFQNLNEKQPKCQKHDHEINESSEIKNMKCNAAQCTPTQNAMHAHAQSTTFIMRIK